MTVVVPTFNERESLPDVASAVLRHGYRLLVVDDGSPDGTGDVADALAAADTRVEVLHRARKEGLGPAYAAGFARAMGRHARIVCEMDADLSHDPGDLPRLVAAIEDGADLAIGSRYVPGGGTEGWPWHRRMLSRGGNLYAALMLGLQVKDVTAGYRAFRREVLELLDASSCSAAGYAFQVEMVKRAAERGLRIHEVPILFRERERGSSKMSGTIVLEAMLLVTRWGLERWVRRASRWWRQEA